ncbi:MAG TPA: transcription-repair coupling factor [Longimicrobiales bacterium]|nr:transcription-repair coupling factor [Longimicrobiales bacterium]
MHPQLIQAMLRQPQFPGLLHNLPAPGQQLRIEGLPGSAPALLAAALVQSLPQRMWVLVAPGPNEADAIESDLQSLLGEGSLVLYPQRETLPYEAAEHHFEVAGLRVEALEALLAGRTHVLVTTVRALQERAEIPTGLADLRLTLSINETIRPLALAERLDNMGFQRSALVEAVGEYALRGGIIDLFGFGAPDPIRIEFWGDEIASIRHFDILNQRSTQELQQADILPVDMRPATSELEHVRRSLLDVLSRDAVLIELEGAHIEQDFERTWAQVLHLHEVEKKRGGSPEAPQMLFLTPAQASANIGSFARLSIRPHDEISEASSLRFNARPAEPIERDIDKLNGLLRAGAVRNEDTFILCDNAGQLERLEELIQLSKDGGIPPRTWLALGAVTGGFVLEGAEPPTRVLTDHEIFRRGRRLRRQRRFRGAVALESLSQLKPGDYVVHLDHGVGRFRGLEHVRIGDTEIESLSIEYAGGEILRVPVYRLDLIERWVPDQDEATAPKLHKIGGKTWKNLRAKTEKAIEEMAQELLQLYAERQLTERPPYSPDSRWQREMESAFLYEDTPDQRQATADVKRDLESRHPMDRLLCGDVGYGKTEIAIRSAFKAVQDGKQVAVLAPTTILVEQHAHTFGQRLAGFPVRIEALSRFRTQKEHDRILAQLAGGEIDIIIGTHALLDPGIVFKELGLLVIDEEQRFGVKQKERFKEMKRGLDVLALTATPIPRTLHLSLTGLRDLSLLQTPPRDRMPILTHVLPWVDEILEDAIHRELDRAGQVFFLHNRVQTIDSVAEEVRRIAPDAKVDVAHGQMGGPELDRVMRKFLEGDTQILVTTAIIENGLDVPTANTLIVDRADQFGLAQLYQIRGRVGRSHHRAYCYLLTPENINEEAEKRLRILEHYTELGAGYAIAMKDLELRGAGNLLGAAQSGFVHAVGLDTYTRLLEDTIRRLREDKSAETHPPTDVSVEGSAYLPDSYVADASQKLHLYRRLSRIEHVGEVHALAAEVRDRYGPPPDEVERLIAAAALRLLGTRLGVERITIQREAARVTFRDGVVARLASLQPALRDHQVELEIKRTAPLSFVLRRRGGVGIVDIVASALEGLLHSQSPVSAIF